MAKETTAKYINVAPLDDVLTIESQDRMLHKAMRLVKKSGKFRL